MSTISEEKMGEGSFSIDLDPFIPTETLDKIDPRTDEGLGGAGFARLIVTRQHMPVGNLTADQIIALARYSGIITDFGEDRLSFEGVGMLGLLGQDQDGGTFRVPPTSTTPDRGLFGHLQDTVLLGTLSANGLSIGTVDGTGAETWPAKLEAGTTRRMMLDTIVGMPDDEREYHVKPDGAIDVMLPANLWASGDVILTRDGGEDTPNLRSIAADLSFAGVGVGDYATDVIVDVDGTANYGAAANTQPTTWRGIAGDLIEWWRFLGYQPRGRIRGRPTWLRIGAWLANNQTRANNIAVAEANRSASYRFEVQAEADLYDPWSIGKPGDKFYVYDLPKRIYDRANPIGYRGRQIYPKLLTLVSWRIPIRRGYGVYVRVWRSGAYELVDITRWVIPADEFVVMELGTRSRHHRRNARPRRGGHVWPAGVPWRRRQYGRRVQATGAGT